MTAALISAALLIACRILLGPLTLPVPVRSPINLEGAFGLAAILLVLIRSESRPRCESQRRPLDRLDALAVIVIALIVVTAFWRAAGFYFLSDDFILLKFARLPVYYRNTFTLAGGDGFYRPLTHLSMSLTSAWAGLDPTRWHSIGFALHAMNSILVFLLAWRLGLSRMGACFASALFAVHATRPEPVIWIAARADLLATFFVLLALLFFIRSWEAQGSPRAVFLAAVSLLAMVLAFLSKESSYTLPLLLLVFLASRDALNRRRACVALAPFFAVAAGFFAWRWYLFGGIGGYLNPSGQPEALSLGFLPLVKTFGLRLWAILFFPINWSNQPGPLLGIVTIGYLAALAWLVRARALLRALMVPLGFLLLLALPPLQQLLIGADLQKSRMVYLPSVAFCLLLAVLAENLPLRPQWAVTFAILTFNLAALVHNLSAWEYASQKAKLACAVAAACPNRANIPELPHNLNGVYFFANGFQECVELQPTRNQKPETRNAPCRFTWDNATNELVPYEP